MFWVVPNFHSEEGRILTVLGNTPEMYKKQHRWGIICPMLKWISNGKCTCRYTDFNMAIDHLFCLGPHNKWSQDHFFAAFMVNIFLFMHWLSNYPNWILSSHSDRSLVNSFAVLRVRSSSRNNGDHWSMVVLWHKFKKIVWGLCLSQISLGFRSWGLFCWTQASAQPKII